MYVAECKFDLNFVVDSSGSINYYDNTSYGKQLEFIVDVVNEFTIGPNDVQVALVLFSLEASVKWGFTEYQDKDSLIDAIRNLPYLESWTNLNDALFLTHSEVYAAGKGARADVPSVTIIITDGVDNIPEEGTPLTLQNAEQCKSDGIWLIAVGITYGVDEERLKQITSPADYYFVEDFDTLPIIVDDIWNQICGPLPGHFSSFTYSFLPAQRYASAGICYSISICLCVICVLCFKTAEHFVEILSLPDSPIVVVFRRRGSLLNSDGFTSNWVAKYKVAKKLGDFDQ